MVDSKKGKRIVGTVILLLFVVAVFLWLRSRSASSVPSTQHESRNRSWLNEPIQPIPIETDLDTAKVKLGEKLFNDVHLSHNDTISCASCHSLDLGGTDQRSVSIGMNNQAGEINAPSVFNSSYNFKQFWDGRAETLEDQVDGPTHAADEMASNWTEIKGKLNQSADYRTAFADLYTDGIQDKNIKDAIATFERSLSTPNSRFDQYLNGNRASLSADEIEGYKLFKTYGCVSCHQGTNVGGNMFQRFGVMGDYFSDRGHPTKADLGRFNVTHNVQDKYVFKVPSLRNVELTFPYLHDGSAPRLETAVGVMSKYQLGRELSHDEIAKIVKFLRTLTGERKH